MLKSFGVKKQKCVNIFNPCQIIILIMQKKNYNFGKPGRWGIIFYSRPNFILIELL